MHIETPDVIEFSSGFNNPPGWENPAQKHIARSETRGRGQKILVVDDSLAWLQLAREILTAGGYQVHAREYHKVACISNQTPQKIQLDFPSL